MGILVFLSYKACPNFKYDKAIKSIAKTSDVNQDCDEK